LMDESIAENKKSYDIEQSILSDIMNGTKHYDTTISIA
jgi:hypothetical protein